MKPAPKFGALSIKMSSCMFADNQQPPTSPSSFQTIQNSPKKKKRRSNTTYKHVPHSAKPVQVVAKRNARERKRVQNVNSAFTYLRRHIPYENRHKRLSKVKTLRIAIDYIQSLQSLISEHDQTLPSKENSAETWKNMEVNNTPPAPLHQLPAPSHLMPAAHSYWSLAYSRTVQQPLAPTQLQSYLS
ncbi:DgyrCDS11986 [Dimorphilus gyrociliatus]|uniref:DgyrCDS11986 n=1 Tax=Dimorphilus gyrociliatus TaxID=2664684 RepID=A0A7I8W610_9ANNE|nr:DgyrCDS11986 [Dimorphilus gyrociliatus]